ncbi:MAG TPA: SgcJ/EcaC family oxidoreductase [Candidatus Eisenbacteria bacterium]
MSDLQQEISDLVATLERAWNAADGAAFARPFAEDADFVNVRADHHRTREAIARGHQGIFDTIYKGSVVHYQLASARLLAPGVALAHINARLEVPAGPMAGTLASLASLVLTGSPGKWQVAAFHNTLVATR